MGAGIDQIGEEVARVSRPAVASLREVPGLPLPDPRRDGRLPLWIETTRLLRQKVGDEIAIMGRADQGPFGVAFLLEDTQQFLMDLLLEDEEVVHAAIEHCMHAGVAFARAQLEAGADLTAIGDSVAGQSVVSPDIYRRFAQPYERHYKELLGDGWLSLHICGKSAQIITEMVDTGAEVLELDHFNNLSDVFRTVGDSVCVWGNIDPSAILFQGTPEMVLDACRQAIRAAREAKARFVLCPGCTVGSTTSPENVRAMSQAAREIQL